MKPTDKYTKLVAKFNRLTKEKKINWKKTKPPFALKAGVDDVWIDFYSAWYADTHIGIGETRFQNYSDDYDKFYWSQKIVWVLLDDNGELEYEFGHAEGLMNLLETIRRTLSDVDSKIDHLINAPDEEAEVD